MNGATAAAAPARGRRRTSKNEEKTGMLWWAGQIFSWLLLLTVLAIAAVMIVIPRVGGATAYTVLTGSMAPGMPPGSLAVVRPVDPATLRTGDVITYQLKSGAPAVVTHRVVGVGSTLDGELRFTARGDANTANDLPVRSEQIRGSLWYQLPWLGHVNSVLTGPQRQWLTFAAVTGLLGYSAFMAISALRDRLERTKKP
ncbi:hypothetical protein ART_4046 [Arthrobacter sp. PAMC 25486]|uniref:signal peptidase I n=1 Tax=Arthrobacter sp. PAMC 25486 TaxID=1494608 RepID=UPI000535A1E3|nr:signal peptidase I [Arthrobacter sp. PAMC 25486]AIY03645.1 hypothetical protein ART_4046 [Arthrobacter sp. PAMC 25486]